MRRLPGQPHVLPQSHQISVTKPCFQVFSASSAFTLCGTDSPALFWSVCRLCPLCRDLALGVVHAEVDAAVATSSLPGCVPPVVVFTSTMPFPMASRATSQILIPCRRPGCAPHCTRSRSYVQVLLPQQHPPLAQIRLVCFLILAGSWPRPLLLTPSSLRSSLGPELWPCTEC